MFSNGAYVKIWKIEKGNGNYYTAEMSTSKKMKDKNGNEIMENGRAKYETDWSDRFVRLVGTAARQAETFKAGDSIQIENCGVTNKYDKDKNTTYTNYTIFAFKEDKKSANTAPKYPASATNVPDTSDEELPFN